ncbi:hypothetical protein [Nocardia vinacea]|uniref:hypothetical protein n=1 Tax=Nocardia vinacea TaxID=96468 RepID=UPI0002D8C0F7|nr:hypothetical protein [Nocardia vinacea]
MAASAIATGALLTQSNLPSPDDSRTEKELAQLTDDQSTLPEQLVDDDYDVNLEEPVIDDARPKSLQEFAEDARTGGSSNAEPIVLGPMGELEPAQPGQSVIEWMGPR